ncbi:uncharacterized protein SPSK_01305 [Sporothrix schenckii 1099-18]|uniref:Uncharacterized protein n=1 Tax=Sporothrix schenckii 1099-18 TaxID=1397361 RepID=A0A0F2LX14_SPOSC|nr:uncharacterized protein SPSK_01305 [Sporothrix schenckii 1099-18]KJR81399.1 hypothetical protein SPSK_01305 [Sporothrix schenckii 1099-18]
MGKAAKTLFRRIRPKEGATYDAAGYQYDFIQNNRQNNRNARRITERKSDGQTAVWGSANWSVPDLFFLLLNPWLTVAGGKVLRVLLWQARDRWVPPASPLHATCLARTLFPIVDILPKNTH